MGKTYLAGLAVLSLLVSPAMSSAQQESGGVPLTSHLYMTGGISHESIADGLPAYAHSRFHPGLEQPGLPGETTYRSGFTYDNGAGSGVFLDLLGTYELATAVRASQTQAAETRVRKSGQGFSVGMFTRFLMRGQFFINVNRIDVTKLYHPAGGGDPLRTVKPVTRSECGVRFPVTRRSSLNLIGSVTGGGGEGGLAAGNGELVLDAIAGVRTGPFSTVFGISNIFDKRSDDPLLDSNGLHRNPGRNFFVQLISRF